MRCFIMFFTNRSSSIVPQRSILIALFFSLITLSGIPLSVNAKPDSADSVISITMKNFKFVPSNITIPAGEKVTLKFHNKGTVTHAFMAGNVLTKELEGFKNGLFSGMTVVKKVNGKTSKKTYHDQSLMLGVKPNHTATLTFTMPESKEGSYHFGCFKTTGTHNVKHYKLGMKGTIQVKGNLAVNK